MFRIGQRITCVDNKFVGENRVYDPTFTVRCPNLRLKGHVYTVRGFVVPYAGYLGTSGILLEEISNPPCPYFEGTFDFSRRTFGRSLIERPTSRYSRRC